MNINPIELYERLYNDEFITFDLCANHGVKFEKSKGYEYTTKEKFERTIGGFIWIYQIFFN